MAFNGESVRDNDTGMMVCELDWDDQWGLIRPMLQQRLAGLYSQACVPIGGALSRPDDASPCIPTSNASPMEASTVTPEQASPGAPKTSETTLELAPRLGSSKRRHAPPSHTRTSSLRATTAATTVRATAATATAAPSVSAMTAAVSASTTTATSTTVVRVVLLPHLLLDHGSRRGSLPPRRLQSRVLALLDGVELARAARIVADARHVLPVAPVGVGVVIHQPALEELGAVTPVPAQVLGEEARDVLATAVGHEAGVDELDHVGVNQRHPRARGRPPNKRVFAVRQRVGRLPLVRLGLRRARRNLLLDPAERKEVRAKLPADKVEVVAPQQLKQDPVAATLGVARGCVKLRGALCDQPRREQTVCERRSKLGAVVGTQHLVARLLVVRRGRRLCAAKVVFEAFERLGLAAAVGEGRVRHIECGWRRGDFGEQLLVAQHGLVEQRLHQVLFHGLLAVEPLCALGREAEAAGRIVDLHLGERLELIGCGDGLAEHVRRLDLLAEVGEDVRELFDGEAEVARVDERLALEQLERTLEVGEDGVEAALHVDLLGVDLAAEVRSIRWGDNGNQEQEVDSLCAVDARAPDAEFARLGKLRAALAAALLAGLFEVGEARDLYMALVPDVDGEDVGDGLLECGGRGRWLGAEVEDGVVVEAEIVAKHRDEHVACHV
ncbi:hypothetical protein L1887_52635 [Cichorium endivia]|nr:hypothetical protein L1887_52635 [Cichorium endivia]